MMKIQNFIDELKTNCKTEERSKSLLNLLKDKLNDVQEQWANEIVESIKKEFQNKARTGKYEISKGIKTIKCEYKPRPYIYRAEKGYHQVKTIKKDVELEKLLYELRIRDISTAGLCYSRYDTDDEFGYNCMDQSTVWTSKVKRKLSVGQKLSGFFTFGLFFLFCLFAEHNYDSYPEERVYSGTIRFDYLFTKCCSSVKDKLKEENIIFDGFKIEYADHYNWSDYRSGYTLLGIFQDINTNIPIKYIDSILNKDKHNNEEICKVPMKLSILCRVVLNK